MGNGRNHIKRQSFCLGSNDGGLSLGGITSCMLALITHTCLIAPVYLASKEFGAFFDKWIIFIKPLLNCFTTLFLSAFCWLLWPKPPAFKVGANRSSCDADMPQAPHQILDDSARPQSKGQLHLLGAFITNNLLQLGFLGLSKLAAFTRTTPPLSNSQTRFASLLVTANPVAHGDVMNTKYFSSITPRLAFI